MAPDATSRKAAASLPVYTIGHSTRSLEELFALLDQHEVRYLADVRSYPRSRTNPQFNLDRLSSAAPEAGIRYQHVRGLGGRRSGKRGTQPSPNPNWKNEAFRNYADYALSQEFRECLAELKTQAAHQISAILCAEAVWWRCHRRIIADYLLAAGVKVFHIMGEKQAVAATLTPGARVIGDDRILYDQPPNPSDS